MATHIVKSGETLGAIAKKYLGKSSSYMVIAKASGIEDPNRVAVGTKLTIPDDLIKADEAQTPAPADSARSPSSASATDHLDAQQLQDILKTDDSERVDSYLAALNACFARYEIDTPLRIAHFLAQVCHESNNFKAVSENLNYSSKALTAIFGKYFDADSAQQYGRKPEQIANRVYASRMGNGDEASGEGWAYRGRGLMQLTGKDNYQNFSDDYGVDVVANPEQVAEDSQLCVAVAGWYWHTRKLNQYADADNIKTITKRINGGYHGLEDREQKLANAKMVLGLA